MEAAAPTSVVTPKPTTAPEDGTRTTRHDALASLGGNHAFRNCVAELLKHRGEERSQEQSEYRQHQ